MDNLLKELETLRISGDFGEQNSWRPCVDLIQRSLVPQRTVGADRPCEEKDFREYRLVVDRNLRNVGSMLQHVLNGCREKRLRPNDDGAAMARTFGTNLLLLVGEHAEKHVWNTAECVAISKEMLVGFCELYACQSVSQFFLENDNFSNLLLMLRPKLLKDTWKTYPAAVACYKWILQEAEVKPFFVFLFSPFLGDVRFQFVHCRVSRTRLVMFCRCKSKLFVSDEKFHLGFASVRIRN